MRFGFRSGANPAKPFLGRSITGYSVVATTIAMGLLLGLVDFMTGPFLQFPFFFLIPIALAAWHTGRRTSFSLAFLLPLARPLIWFPIWRNGFEAEEAATLGIRVFAANAAIKILVFVLFAEMMHRIADASRFRQQVISTLPVGLWVTNRRGIVIQASPAGCGIWGSDSVGETPESIGIHSSGDAGEPAVAGIPGLRAALGEGQSVVNEVVRIRRSDGGEREVLSSAVPIRDARGAIAGALLVQVDVTESKRLERERESLIRSHQAAQREVKILKGMLPICSGCKRIRDDKKSWIQMESYIRSHSEADFTHGICPECIKKMYPWFTA